MTKGKSFSPGFKREAVRWLETAQKSSAIFMVDPLSGLDQAKRRCYKRNDQS